MSTQSSKKRSSWSPPGERIRGSCTDDHAAHQHLDALKQQLKAGTQPASNPDQADIDAFDPDMSLFQAAYLDYMAQEEATAARLMMDHFSDEELIGH